MHGERCPICDMGNLKKEVVAEPFEYKGQKITIPNYIKYRCDKCGEAVVDNGTLRKSGKILKDFQRKVDGLLTGEEIKKIRKKLDLSQEELAEIIGGGLKSVARYESGQVCQSRGMDNLLRILDAYPFTLNIIKKDKGKMPFIERNIIKIDFKKGKKDYVSKPSDYNLRTQELKYGT